MPFNPEKSDFSLLFRAFCPKCKKDIYEVADYTTMNGLSNRSRVKNKEISYWLAYKEANLLRQKASKSHLYVSEATLLFSKNPELVSKTVLKRYS